MFRANTFKISVFMLLLLSSITIQAQQSKSGKKSWDSAKKAIENKNYNKCILEAKEAILSELAVDTNQTQFDFYLNAYQLLGRAFEAIGRKDSAIKYLYQSLGFSKSLHDTMSAAEIMMHINGLYHLCRSDTGDIWLQKLMNYPKTEKNYLMFRTKYLDTTRYDWKKGDTCWITSNGGLNDGVFADAPIGFYSIYQPSYRVRPVQFIGLGKILYSYAQSSYGYFVFNEDFNDTIYVRDGVYTECGIPQTLSHSDIQKSSIAGFSSAPVDSNRFYIYPTTSLYFNDPFYNTAIYTKMLLELKTTALKDGDYHGFASNMLIKSGRFKGFTLKEALQNSTIYDVMHFVNIPATYTSTYYNYSQEFVYEYIFWLSVEAYTGANQSILWDLVQNTPMNQIENVAKTYNFYYSYWELLDSFFLSFVDTIDNYKSRVQMSTKFLAFAENSMQPMREAKWLDQLCIDAFTNTQFTDAEKYANQWRNKVKNPHYPWLFGGVSARFNRNYDKANLLLDSVISDEKSIQKLYGTDTAQWILKNAYAYKAWCLLRENKKTESLELVSKSFAMDSNNRGIRPIYAFAKAMNGEFAEASRHLDSTLELLWSPHQFYQIQWCFEELRALPNAPDWLITEQKRITYKFENEYIHKIILDSMRNRAAEKYEVYSTKIDAFEQYEAALKYSKKYLSKDSSNLIFILDWLGYIGVELGKDSMALEYYLNAYDVCKQFRFNSEKQLLEVENIIFTANQLGRSDLFRTYSIKQRELKAEINSRKEKNLYIISCGTNQSSQSDITEKYAEKDALILSEKMAEKGQLFYDNVIKFPLTGDKLTLANLDATLDSVAKMVGENDVFVFYYAGPTMDNSGYVQLNLNNDFYLASELSNKMSLIGCSKKIVLLDGGNLPVDSLSKALVRFDGNFNDQSNLLLGVQEWRQESNQNQHGVLTGSILKFLDNKDGGLPISSSALVNFVVEDLKVNKISLAVSSISHGFDIELGTRPFISNTTDTTYPEIILYNARSVKTRSENIPIRSTGEDEFIRGEIHDASGNVMAFINGTRLVIQPNGRFSYPKKLLKSDTFIIYAHNKIITDSVIAVLEKSIKTVVQNKKLAFLFANPQYDNPKWGELENTLNDANAIGDLLHDYYGFTTEVIPSFTSTSLTQKLISIKRTPFNKGDQLLIFFAGHGYYNADIGFKLVCKDAENPDSGVFKNYISGSELQDMIEGIKCDNKFLIIDNCYAGNMAKPGKYTAYSEVSSALKPEDFINRQKNIPVFQFYFSSQTNPVEEGVRGSHSPFALQLIDNLTNGAKKDYVNLQYLRTNEAQYGKSESTMPIAGYWSRGDNGEFILKVTNKITDNGGPIAGPEKPSNSK